MSDLAEDMFDSVARVAEDDRSEAEVEVDSAREVLGIDSSLDPLTALLGADPPADLRGDWFNARTGARFVIRPIEDDSTFGKLQDRATTVVKQKRGGRTKELDGDKFARLLAVTYTESPSFAEGSSDYLALCKKYEVDPDHGSERLITRVLLKGEIESLGRAILDLSGYDEDLVEVGKD